MHDDEKLRKELKKIGYEYEFMNDRLKDYFRRIFDVCEDISESEKEIHAMRSRNYVSIQNISEKTKISRQTFYNQPILMEYVNFKAHEFEKIDDSFILMKVKEENEELKRKIELMHKRDIEFMELKNENAKLKDDLKKKDNLLKIATQKMN